MRAPGRAGTRDDLAISGTFSGDLPYLSAFFWLLSGGKNPENRSELRTRLKPQSANRLPLIASVYVINW